MNLGLRQTILGNSGYKPWNKRFEYIQFYDIRNFFAVCCGQAVNVGTPEEQSVVLSFDNMPTGDKKYFGTSLSFAVATYQSSWRPSGYATWDANPVISESLDGTYKIRWTVSLSDGGELFDLNTNTVIYRYPAATQSDWIDNMSGKYGPRQIGMSSSDSFDIPKYIFMGFGVSLFYEWLLCNANDQPTYERSSDFAPHKFYDYYRKINGKTVIHLVPCEVNGIVGVCDEISGQFFTSNNNLYLPLAGPEIK